MLNNLSLTVGGSGMILLVCIVPVLFMAHEWTKEDTLRLIFVILATVCMFLSDLLSGYLF